MSKSKKGSKSIPGTATKIEDLKPITNPKGGSRTTSFGEIVIVKTSDKSTP